MGLSETDTRVKLIDPKLRESAWDEGMICREVQITNGAILDSEGNRKPPRFADYVLYYGGFAIAIVEAKEEEVDYLKGLKQAKDYCKMWLAMFAYSTNGHKIEEFDFTTMKQKTIDRFPTPAELFHRYIVGKFGKLSKDPLSEPFYRGRYPLRYYQDAAIKKIIEGYLTGKKRILIAMATGSGKTKVSFQTVWKLYNAGNINKVLFITDRNFLVQNAVSEFEPFFSKDAADIIENQNVPHNRDILFATYQSLYGADSNNRPYKKYDPDFFDLIIIDECHRSGYGTWRTILDRFKKARVLGMTATPKRADNIDTYQYFGDPVYEYSLGRGIEDGFLAPYRINKLYTNLDAKGGLSVKQAIEEGAEIYTPSDSPLKEWYKMSELWRSLILPDHTETICNHLADLLYTYGPMDKTMVFCVTQEHARLVSKILQNRFSHLGYDNYAVTIVSEESDMTEEYNNFKDPEKKIPVVATTVDLLSTGVDVPSVKNIVFLKPIASKIVFKQIIGRGSRINVLTGKYQFRIIDYSNATRLFDDWDKPEEPLKEMDKAKRDYSLKGTILDKENGTPLQNATVNVLLGVNDEVTVKTNTFGSFQLKNLPKHVKLTASAPTYSNFTLESPTYKKDTVGIVIELQKKPDTPKPVRIENVSVWIEQEISIELIDGTRVSKAKYTEYSKNEVLKRIITLNDLRRIWTNQRKREAFTRELLENSVSPKTLAAILEAPSADPFDIIAHIAFGIPIVSRDSRSEAFMNSSKDFIDSFGRPGTDIILNLLEKYRIDGIDNIEDPKIFDLYPFDKMGHILGVADKVGGLENLKKIIEQIQVGLYKND